MFTIRRYSPEQYESLRAEVSALLSTPAAFQLVKQLKQLFVLLRNPEKTPEEIANITEQKLSDFLEQQQFTGEQIANIFASINMIEVIRNLQVAFVAGVAALCLIASAVCFTEVENSLMQI